MKRPARITGWIPIRYSITGESGLPRKGGLVEISRAGAKLYLTGKFRPGDRISLVLRMPGEPKGLPFLMRVVWVRQDEPGRVEAFEARLKFLQDMVREGGQAKGMTYGYLVGVKFEPGMNPEHIRVAQRYFDRERGM